MVIGEGINSDSTSTVQEQPLIQPIINGVNVLTCLITIGDYDRSSPDLISKNRHAFMQCINIDINDSYETLMNTATVTLPRDMFAHINEHIGADSKYKRDKKLEDDEIKSLFNTGSRISIRLGYDNKLKTLFEGFIISVDPTTPFVLHCEDFGWNLKRKVVYPADVITTHGGTNVNEFIDKLLDGTDIELHETTRRMNLKLGLVHLKESRSLSEILESWKTNFGLMSFIKLRTKSEDVMVKDPITGELTPDKKYSIVPCLALSRTYFSENKDQTLIDGDQSNIDQIWFNTHVVKDNLTFSYLDYDTLALEATTIDKENKRMKATIVLNKGYTTYFAAINAGGLDGEISRTEEEIKKAKKAKDKTSESAHSAKLVDLKTLKADAASQSEFNVVNIERATKKEIKTDNIKKENKLDMIHYNVRSYYEYSVDLDTLIKNAKAKFKTISQTGVEGSLTVFGDFGFRSASLVRLVDTRHPEKNGAYVISEVKTSFGVDGYRQTLKLPFKRST